VTGLLAEAVSLLAELIQARSCNPPGNEEGPARVLAAYLRRGGLDVSVLAATPGRPNVVARVRGPGTGPSLLLLSHLDTVGADPGEWSVDPWSGTVRGGCIWGRGALDLKGQAAAQAVAVASLARAGAAFRGDIVVAATADEERGSRYGTRWLLDAHPGALKTDYALTHGAGDRVVIDGRPVYFCATAERAAGSFTVTFTGPAGLSMLAAPNVIAQASRFVVEAAGQHVSHSVPDEVATVIGSLTGTVPPPSGVAAAARAVHPAVGVLLAPLAGVTLAPSGMRSAVTAGRTQACDVDFDCWLAPGQELAEVRAILDRAAAGLAYDITWRPVTGGTRSPVRTPLWRAIEDYVGSCDPGSLLLPLCDAGFTDSHWLRSRYGTVAYGFFPMRELTTLEAARAVHGPDERLPLADLALQIGFYRQVVTSLCGPETAGSSERG
jgi:acetylornithine deacetylase/succinyl-diaminopimelate desuccinylase-like protein